MISQYLVLKEEYIKHACTSKGIITFCAITKFKESFCHIRVNLTCHSTSGILERNDTPVIRSLRTPDIIVEFMFPEGM